MRVFYFINLEAIMSAGTITLTNNSAAVSGAGTAFTSELKEGDFLVTVVGGVPYTMPVKSVNNNTSLVLISNFTGPTQSGVAWSAVPRTALNMVTAALVTSGAEALRGLNYDKQNWQQVFSGTGTITVKLPDGSAYTGPAWNSFTAELSKKANNSDLGTAAKKNVQTSSTDNTVGNVLLFGGFGAGGDAPHVSVIRTQFDSGIYAYWGDNSDINYGKKYGVVFNAVYAAATYKRTFQIFIDSTLGITARHYNQNTGNESSVVLYTTGNTTKASDGTLKAASPIVKIFSDGTFETNEESIGVKVNREGVGAYRITNVLGMNSDGTWGGVDGGFDVPKDRNGQRLIWLDYEVEADGSILVKTYHRTYPDAPVFARNIKEGYEEGDLIDIPSDQFVSVRVEMPQDSIWNMAQGAAQEEMEQEQIAEE